jgi:hypothetical protein
VVPEPVEGEGRKLDLSAGALRLERRECGGACAVSTSDRLDTSADEGRAHIEIDVHPGDAQDLRTARPCDRGQRDGNLPEGAAGGRQQALEGGVLTTLMDTLPKSERYSYVFEGNSQVLDQILVSDNLLGNFGVEYDPVHVNSEFADQASDHDPQVARLDLRGIRCC